MPDVDYCVREAEFGLCEKTDFYSNNISKIENNKRVKVFRDKDEKTIRYILTTCSNTIKTYILNEFYEKKKITLEEIKLEHASNDNKDGADLIHKISSNEIIDIEVKFGDKTDKNIGMKVFEKIFGCNVFTKALSLEQRKKMIDMYIADGYNDEEQLKRLYIILNKAVQEFNLFLKGKNYTLSNEEQKYMEDNILNTSGNKKHNHYIKFILDGEDMSSMKTIPTGKGHWIVNEVQELSQSIKRVNVFVKNYDTNVQIKYVLNWKNNYKIDNNIKADSKLGFGSSSWNVWVTVEIAQQ